MSDREEIDWTALRTSLWSLPLLDNDPFLHIQCFNLGMVDQFITGLELEVLRLYHEEKRTPMETSFLSAQSQMWIFALYEVLRMWRERCDKMIAWSDNGILPARLAHYERDVGYQHHGNLVRAGQVKAAIADPTIIDRIRRDLRRTDIQFTWMAALRMSLAKHEVMGKHGVVASQPGYARIDMYTGSLTYAIENPYADIGTLSRRNIADGIRRLLVDDSVPSDEELAEFHAFVKGTSGPAFDV